MISSYQGQIPTFLHLLVLLTSCIKYWKFQPLQICKRRNLCHWRNGIICTLVRRNFHMGPQRSWPNGTCCLATPEESPSNFGVEGRTLSLSLRCSLPPLASASKFQKAKLFSPTAIKIPIKNFSNFCWKFLAFSKESMPLRMALFLRRSPWFSSRQKLQYSLEVYLVTSDKLNFPTIDFRQLLEISALLKILRNFDQGQNSKNPEIIEWFAGSWFHQGLSALGPPSHPTPRSPKQHSCFAIFNPIFL